MSMNVVLKKNQFTVPYGCVGHVMGATVPYSCVGRIMSALESLAQKEPKLIFKLLKKALIPNYELKDAVKQRLQKYDLVDSKGDLTDDEKEVIRCAIEADLVTRKSLTIVNPLNRYNLISCKWDDDGNHYSCRASPFHRFP